MIILFIIVFGMAAGWIAQMILGGGGSWAEAILDALP